MRWLLIAFVALCLAGGAFAWHFLSPPATPPFESKILQSINETCTGNTLCTLQMSTVTPFDWDKMYAFEMGIGASEMNQLLGTNDAEYCDLQRHLIFLKNGKIVFQECEPEGIEEATKNEMTFDIPETGKYKSYPHDVVFLVTQGTSKEGPWFNLKQIR
jgi:hypothetical protein